MMESSLFFIGCVLIFIVGFFLGVLGAGGSLFSIPILIYCFNLTTDNALGASYIITGITALVAAILYFKDINWNKYSYFFIMPAIVMTWLTRHNFIPYLEKITNPLVVQQGLMYTLGILMFISALFMVFYKPKPMSHKNHYYLTVFLAMIYGALVGSIGTGGGFFLIPIFTILLHMSLKQAVATSLSLVALTTLFGLDANTLFLKEVSLSFITLMTSISFLGMLVGQAFHNKYSQQQLKSFFIAVSTLTGLAIIFNQLTHVTY